MHVEHKEHVIIYEGEGEWGSGKKSEIKIIEKGKDLGHLLNLFHLNKNTTVKVTRHLCFKILSPPCPPPRCLRPGLYISENVDNSAWPLIPIVRG